MSTNTLNNFSLQLWRNPEGYHVTVTTNYNLATEKRSFFSFGAQTYRSWKAYNLHQPIPLKEYFAGIKEIYKPELKNYPHNFWISKLGVNTGTHGRRTAAGMMILQEIANEFHYIMHLKELTFEGVFDPNNLTEKQKKGAKGVCLGSYMWKEDDEILEYAEAF